MQRIANPISPLYKSSRKRGRAPRGLRFESLENRTVFSATAFVDNGGVLQIQGTTDDDEIIVRAYSPDGWASPSQLFNLRSSNLEVRRSSQLENVLDQTPIGQVVPSQFEVLINGERLGLFSDPRAIVVDSLDGNDFAAVRDFDGKVALRGGNGNDTLLYAGQGNCLLEGNAGDDKLFTDVGADLLIGGEGNDSLWGGEGNDRIFGGFGDDYLSGDAGDDRLDGGVGNDQIFGRLGNDILLGEEGNDQLNGGLGRDKLFAGLGDDTLTDSHDYPWEDGLGHPARRTYRVVPMIHITPGRDGVRDMLDGGPGRDTATGPSDARDQKESVEIDQRETPSWATKPISRRMHFRSAR